MLFVTTALPPYYLLICSSYVMLRMRREVLLEVLLVVTPHARASLNHRQTVGFAQVQTNNVSMDFTLADRWLDVVAHENSIMFDSFTKINTVFSEFIELVPAVTVTLPSHRRQCGRNDSKDSQHRYSNLPKKTG